MTETRIRWEPTEHGGWTGHVGTFADWLFQIWDAASVGGVWQLDSTLPGDWRRIAASADPDELKAEAKRWLEQFVVSLGAVFPDSPAASPGWTLRVHMQREPGSDRAACSNDPRFRAVTGDPSKVTCAACLQRHVASANDALRALEADR